MYLAVHKNGHAWKWICGGMGCQVGILLHTHWYYRMGELSAGFRAFVYSYGEMLVLLMLFLGVMVGALIDHKMAGKRTIASGLRHLFVLILEFALIFAVWKVRL